MEHHPIDIAAYVADIGRRARAASRAMARAPSAAKDRALQATAAAIRREARALQTANARDLDAARTAGHDAAFVDRLALTDKGIEAMAAGLEQIVMLPDLIGEISELRFQ
jgi:glutamate-5-semialdehyde dehydrogenase